MSLKSRTCLRNCTTLYFISIWFAWQGWPESPLMCVLATALVALVRKLAQKTWARLLGTSWLVGPFSRKRSDNRSNVGVRIPNPKISVCGLTEFVNYSHEIWSSVMILCKYVLASDISPLNPDKGEEPWWESGETVETASASARLYKEVGGHCHLSKAALIRCNLNTVDAGPFLRFPVILRVWSGSHTFNTSDLLSALLCVAAEHRNGCFEQLLPFKTINVLW